jgi:hypothetical protein
MNRESCQRYLEDPEANASHLAECADCRTLAETLQASGLRPRASDRRDLPLASWEGASHRAWPLVAAGAIVVAVIATILFAAIGTSPFELLRGNVPSKDVVASILRLADGGAIQNAPVKLQVLIGISFVIVNAILIALLRRAPRGIDV